MKYQLLHGELICLKPYDSNDLEALELLNNESAIWEFYKLGGLTNVKDVVFWSDENRKKNDFYDFVIIDNITKSIIGYTGLFRVNKEKNECEIGGTFIHPAFWGKGYNQESKKILIDFAFNKLSFSKINYICNVLNLRSYYTALNLGFQLEKIIEKKRKNIDNTWADFAHFILKK
jgi:RimJ/RimL family protein N-acetyltransferase